MVENLRRELTTSLVITARPARAALWSSSVLCLLLAVYFAYFCYDSIAVHYAPDDMMNLAYAWRRPSSELLLAPFMVWRPFYRPLAGWVYVPLLNTFGLNPLPLHVVVLIFLLTNVFLVRLLAKLLGACEWAAFTAALVAAYHAGLSNLYYNTAFIYDALCCSFFLAALVYYIHIRRHDAVPNARQTALFLLLYLFSLDSKEMAVTLPAVILLYEYCYGRPIPSRPKGFLLWLRGPGRCVVPGGCLTLIFIAGRIFGTGGLAHDPGYVPQYSMDRVWAFQIRCFSDLFEKWEYFNRATVLAVWAAILYLAWRRRRPLLRFASLFLLIAPLPIEFLSGRAGACLCIPLVAWALFMSVAFVDICGAAARILAREPLLRRVRRRPIAAVLIALGLVGWTRHNAMLKRAYADPAMVDFAPVTWTAIQQLRALHLRIRPHDSIAFLNDPIGKFDMEFIAELLFRDHTLTVLLNRQIPLSQLQIDQAGHLIDYRDGHFLVVR